MKLTINLVTMSCCFQAPRQWCWCFRPPVLRFLVIFFHPTDRPTQNQETYSTLNEQKGDDLSLMVCFCFCFCCCFFFVGEINWNWHCLKTLYIPFGDSQVRIKKWKARGFIDRNGNGVGLGLVTALRFTRALSNGPEKQKEKRGQTIHV